MPPIRSLQCGEYFVMCIDAELSLWGFGSNSVGQIGLGDQNSVPTPQRVPGVRACQVACGYDHTLIVTPEGHLYACGSNQYGQLGARDHRSTKNFISPIRIELPFEVESAYGGWWFSVIRATDGTLWSTGYNQNSELGLGDTMDRNQFTQIPGLVSTQVACGFYHTVAIDDTCRLWGWGSSEFLQLCPLTEDTSVPTILREDACVVLAGVQHTIVLTTTGQVVACGSNCNNQLAMESSCSKSPWAPSDIAADMISPFSRPKSTIKSARSALPQS